MASFGFSGPVRPNFGPPKPIVPAPNLYGKGGLGVPTRPVVPLGGAQGKPGPLGIHSPTPAAPAAPQTPSPTPASQTAGSSPSPLDSTYFDNLAGNQFRVNNQLNALTATSQNDNTALQSALDQLAYQQPRDSLKLEQNANRTGGLYSSVYDQNLGNLQHSYETRQTAATTANAQKQAGIQSQIGALQGGVPIYQSQQYDAAVARAIKAAAANPATGQDQSVSTTPPAPPAPAPATSVGPQLTPQQIQYINAGLANRPTVSAGNVFGKGGFGVPTRPVVSAGNRTGKGKK
jgi:hypothetical protein